MGNELFQARLPDDFAERIHEYREENHMSKSEALRHLLRRGLEAEADKQEPEADTEELEADTETEATDEWDSVMTANRTAQMVGGAVVGLLVAAVVLVEAGTVTLQTLAVAFFGAYVGTILGGGQ